MLLRAEAIKQKKILESEGDALAVKNVQNAKAELLEKT